MRPLLSDVAAFSFRSCVFVLGIVKVMFLDVIALSSSELEALWMYLNLKEAV